MRLAWSWTRSLQLADSAAPTVHLGDWKGARREEALSSFNAFLPHWWFVNRETGQPMRFTPATMWQGQQELADLMETEHWIFALKAGKLGFTQLESAFDAYRALSVPNCRVHLFSMNQNASVSLLEYVKYGLERLPPWFEVGLREDLAGGDKTQSLKISIGAKRDDIRTVVSYPTGDFPAIDQTCIHSHVDEWTRMPHPDKAWGAIQSTVSPEGGTCHIVTRGQGQNDFVETSWEAALANQGKAREDRTAKLVAYFAPYNYRPGRDKRWYELEASTMTPQQMAWFAPEDADDAFAGDATQIYIPMEWWDGCFDPWLREHPIVPGDPIPLVIALDAAITGDCFAAIAVSRHPNRWEDPAIRAVQVWRPAQFPGGRIDFDYVERWIRVMCQGGCGGYQDGSGLVQQHPTYDPDPLCPACQGGVKVPRFNVLQIAYDPHELEQMAQRLRRDRVAWMYEFEQGNSRLEADKSLFDLVQWRRLAHNGNAQLREHVDNATATIPKDLDDKMRIIKKSQARKVDAAVAASMAVFECMRLNISRPA